MNQVLNSDTFPYLLAVILFAVAVLWAIPANCNDVPGPVLFFSALAKLAGRCILMVALCALLVVTAIGCVLGVAAVVIAISPIAILVWLFGEKK